MNRIIGADYCPFCVRVKDYFLKHHIPHTWVDTETGNGAKIREYESKKHNWETIPMVWVNNEFVGGCDDFFSKLKDQKIVFPKI